MGWITSIDVNILLFIQNHLRSDVMTPFWQVITQFGVYFWIPLTLILLIPKKTRRIGMTCAVSMILVFIVANLILKNLVARPRPFNAFPQLTLLTNRPTDYSFPSGHTANSFSCSLILYRMTPKKWGISALVLSALIAFSRLYLGAHYPSDVICGFLIALILSAVAYRFCQRKLLNRTFSWEKRESR